MVSIQKTMKLKHSLTAFSVIAAMMFFYASPTHAQTGNIEKYTLKSSVNHKNYTLQVALPKGYMQADTAKKYKALYVLDGSYSFSMYHSAMAMMAMGSELEELIIIGIDVDSETEKDWLINRHYDFTPTHNPEADKLWAKLLSLPETKLHSGGAALFLSTLELDIIPLIERTYNTKKERGLTGHSLGGLFTAYCLFVKPGLFSNYGINSPSLWWDNFEINKIEKDFFVKSVPVNANVFISVGGLEGGMMTEPLKKFGETLSLRQYSGLKIESQIFEKETHLSVPMASSSRTLKVLYPAVNSH
jgi:predicted alpha/beta superfamily hydrolase